MGMRARWIGMIVALLLLNGAGGAAAQTGGIRPPTIIALAADVAAVPLAALERGEVSLTLQWRIEAFDAVLRVGLDQLVQGQWASVLADDEALAPVGARTFTAAHPGDFAPLTYRLAVITSSGDLLTQQIITIPYAEMEALPFIEQFESDTPALDTAALLQRNALADVRWSIRDRRPGSSLRIEQVLSDQDVILVELPRPSLWLPSSGALQVAPDVPLTEAVVRLRLSVYDLLTGDVYHSAELTLPLSGAPLPIPGLTAAAATPESTPAADPTPTGAPVTAPADAPIIRTFAAQPTSARPGETIIVTWEVENAASISVQEQAANGAAGLLYIELPPSGALSLQMPDDTPGMIYALRAQSASGAEVTAQVVVAAAS